MEAVRPAVPEDGPRVEALAGELLAWVRSQRGGVQLLGPPGRPVPAYLGHATLGEVLADPGRRVLVGTLEGVVTAVAACHVDERPDGRWGVLDGCYVEEGAREVGLGRLLIDSLTDWLDGQGCVGVDGVVLPGDRDAKGFYEAAGYKARLLIMHRPFG